jgi:mono/diheme cytochrome c family protein
VIQITPNQVISFGLWLLSRIAGMGAALAASVQPLLPPPLASADPAAVARGAYLAAAAGCDQCHTDKDHGGAPYAGGRVLETEFGTVATPNITSDRAYGIGRWSAADFVRAMRWGIAPDDSHYVPSFPFPSYGRLTDGDLADLKAFLDTVSPVPRPNREGASLAPAARSWAAAAIALGHAAAPWQPDPAKDAVWNRGGYLVATVGRCGECHTPRDHLGRPVADRFLAGSKGGAAAKDAPNITPDRQSGIGYWEEGEIVALLKEGVTPDGDFVDGAMAEIVHNTARLTDADRRAIAVYLQSLPAKASAARN